MKDYTELALRTASGNFYGEKIALDHFRDVIYKVIAICENMDAIKKSMFYGKDYDIKFDQSLSTLEHLPGWIQQDVSNENGIDILHGIIGKITEVGELAEILLDVCDGKRFDKINAIEEVGDGFWYDAILLNALESNFVQAQAMNIAKLRSRYPEKFTEEKALSRNLKIEREILESKGE